MKVKQIYQENGGFPVVLKLVNGERKQIQINKVVLLSVYSQEPRYKQLILTDGTIIEEGKPLPESDIIKNYDPNLPNNI